MLLKLRGQAEGGENIHRQQKIKTQNEYNKQQ